MSRWNPARCVLVLCPSPDSGRVVFGVADPRAGAAGSVFNLLQAQALNHRAEVRHGVLAEECGALLRDFFRARRLKPATGVPATGVDSAINAD